MSSTNKTTYYELSQYIGTDKPTYLGDYNADMLAIDTAIHNAATDASTAVSTANTANSTATTAATNASTALSTATSAASTATTAQNTAETASTNASAALTAANAAQTAAAANTITNLAPAYDSTLTYAVGDLVTYIDAQGSGKLYKCIVAVETAMEFDINYWDDVTASEVFGKKSQLLATVTADGVMTIKTILNTLFDSYDYDLNAEYLLIDKTSTGASIRHELSHNNLAVRFMTNSVSGSASFTTGLIELSDDDSHFYNWTVTESGATFADQSESLIPASGVTYNLYKLTTV